MTDAWQQYEALAPMIRGASEADYYCPDDVADDHTVLISVTVAELRAARSALSRVSPPQDDAQAEGARRKTKPNKTQALESK